MIGNKIEFYHYEGVLDEPKAEIKQGLVVDAFTKIDGTISGSSEVFLGFGGGRTSGETISKRMYKVETFNWWDKDKTLQQYIDIFDWQLKRIISFANQNNQEVNEEKIIENKKTI